MLKKLGNKNKNFRRSSTIMLLFHFVEDICVTCDKHKKGNSAQEITRNGNCLALFICSPAVYERERQLTTARAI